MQPTKEGKISVSVMCSDLMNLERDIKQLERNGVDYLHVDVMAKIMQSSAMETCF